MPIYEYVCQNCNHTFDELQKIGDIPLIKCPDCEKSELKRLISAPRFRLKGKGWYETDFKKKNQRNILKNDNESSKKEETKKKKPLETKKSENKSSEKIKSNESKPKKSGKNR